MTACVVILSLLLEIYFLLGVMQATLRRVLLF